MDAFKRSQTQLAKPVWISNFVNKEGYACELIRIQLAN